MCFEFKLTFGGEVKKLNLWQNIDPFSMAGRYFMYKIIGTCNQNTKR